MADAQRIAIRPRTIQGKRVSRLRREGVLPGVVYGGHKDSTPVETDMHAFALGYRRWGHTTLVTLEGLPDGEVAALISDVSRDTITGRMLHVDFQRVSLTEKVGAEVPLHFIHESPAVKAGGVLVHAMDHVRVEAYPQDIPHSIEVDLSKLVEIDDAIFVRDLAVDTSKVEVQEDGGELVVKAVPVRVEEVPAPAAAAPTAEAAEGEEAAPAAEGEAKPAAAAGAKPAPGGAAAKPGAPAARAEQPKK